MNPAAPILIFDSGVGGLTILAELRKTLPQAPVIYAADFAGLPYGTKSEAEVAARVCGLLGRMAERYQPRLICIACNTASTIALSMVRDVLEVPIVGTVPAIKPAALATQTGVIGLLGTVIGMIKVFTVITVQGVGNPEVLAEGISQALITTAAGSSVAIPSLLFYRHFQRKVDELVVTMEQESLKMVEVLHGQRSSGH